MLEADKPSKNLISPLPDPRPPTPDPRLPLIIPLSLFGLAFGLRLIYALQLVFPPLDDPAYYIQGARSLREGHPFELDITWNYFPQFEEVRRPGFDFWMPLTAFLIAGSFAIFGDNLLAAQLPGVIAGALLPVLTYYLARRTFATLAIELRSVMLLSGLAGLYIAFNPLLAYQSSVTDSQMIYASAVVAAMLVWISGKSRWHAFGFGILLGLAYLARGHAIFLGLAWFIAALWQIRQEGRAALGRAGFSLLGLGLVAGPWVLRNLLTFGFLTSPAGLQTGLIYDYASLFNYQTPINFSTFAALGPGKILEARLTALQNGWLEVLGVIFFPTVLLPIAGLIWLWRSSRILGFGLLYSLLLGLGVPLIFAVASSTGSFYHSAGSIAPLGAIGLIYLLWAIDQWYRRSRPRITIFPILMTLIVALEIFQLGQIVPTTVAVHRRDQQVYSRLGEWLAANPAGGAVIADEPSTLNYATGLPALRLPADEPLEVVKKLAEHYNVRYIIVTGNFGRYPALLQAPSNTLFSRIYRDPQGEFEIYSTIPRMG